MTMAAAMAPGSLAPALGPAMGSGTLVPTSMAPTSMVPTSMVPTPMIPTSMVPTSMAPTSMNPTSMGLTSMAPTSMVSPSVALPPMTQASMVPTQVSSANAQVTPGLQAPTGAPTKAIASNLSEVDRGRIVGMWEAGRKPGAIALAIPCSKRTACKWINAYRNCGKDGLIDLRRSGLAGRPRKTTEDENLAIMKAVDENNSRAATSSALAALKLRVSDRTIRRRLQEARAERRKRASQSNRTSKKKTSASQMPKGKRDTISRPAPETYVMKLMEPSALVEVNMDTPPNTESCCYVNL